MAGIESEDPWEIHFTWVEDWQPVEGASVTLATVEPGDAREEMAAEPEIAGVYLAAPTLTAAGT